MVHCLPLPEFERLVAEGETHGDTTVFDTTVTTLGAYRERQELSLLAERRWRAEELETALGVDAPGLRGMHQSINPYSKKYRVPPCVRVYGRVRADRSYSLRDEARPFIQALLGS